MITYFVHSTSTDNEKRINSGWSNPDLSDLGREQALRLQQRFKIKPFDIVYCSDLKRAKETASIAFPNSQLITYSNLREMNYGNLNGKPSDHFPLDKNNCIDIRFPNGENCHDVENRIRSFLQGIDNQNLNIAIVGHKYPQFAIDVI